MFVPVMPDGSQEPTVGVKVETPEALAAKLLKLVKESLICQELNAGVSISKLLIPVLVLVLYAKMINHDHSRT